MRILVAGASGMVGSALVPHLLGRGHEICTLVRRRAGNRMEFEWAPGRRDLPPELMARFDAVINLAGANIGERLWTESRLRVLRDSRLDTTECLVKALQPHSGKILLNASATGFFGNRGDEILTDSSPVGEGYLASLCEAWEGAALKAANSGNRVCCLRFGLVLGEGGFLEKLHPVFKAGLGGRLGDGSAWMSWIALEDLVSGITLALDESVLSGQINLVSPNPVRNADFTRLYARTLARKAPWTIPAWFLKLVLGKMGRELFLSSTRAVPGRLQQLPFRFRRAELRSALFIAEEARRLSKEKG